MTSIKQAIENRAAILAAVPGTVGMLSGRTGIKPSNLKHHLQVMRDEGLIDILGTVTAKRRTVWGRAGQSIPNMDAPRKVQVPITACRSRWVGGHYPGVTA